MDKKSQFNEACLSVVSYLETFDECKKVEFSGATCCTESDLDAWERKNMPYKLPHDLRRFYQLFDGYCLTYGVEVGGAHVHVGTLETNRLANVIRMPIEGEMEGVDMSLGGIDGLSCAAFALDDKAECGTVALLYRGGIGQGTTSGSDLVMATAARDANGEGGAEAVAMAQRKACYENPQVWFQDMSARWHYLSATFSDFLRLQVMHVGVHGWQLVYTAEGAPPLTQQWMQLFCRERLTMDLSR